MTHGVSGVVFAAGNPNDLLQQVRETWFTPSRLEQMALGARAAFGAHYTEDANYSALLAIYNAAQQRECHAALPE